MATTQELLKELVKELNKEREDLTNQIKLKENQELKNIYDRVLELEQELLPTFKELKNIKKPSRSDYGIYYYFGLEPTTKQGIFLTLDRFGDYMLDKSLGSWSDDYYKTIRHFLMEYVKETISKELLKKYGNQAIGFLESVKENLVEIMQNVISASIEYNKDLRKELEK